MLSIYRFHHLSLNMSGRRLKRSDLDSSRSFIHSRKSISNEADRKDQTLLNSYTISPFHKYHYKSREGKDASLTIWRSSEDLAQPKPSSDFAEIRWSGIASVSASIGHPRVLWNVTTTYSSKTLRCSSCESEFTTTDTQLDGCIWAYSDELHGS